MSEFKIKDGTGVGDLAKVNTFNRLEVTADIEDELAFASRRGDSFAVGSGLLTLTTSDTGPMFWLKNASTSKDFHVTRINFNYNGGSTNHNRICKFFAYNGMTEPSANNSAKTAGNLNFTNSNVADLTVYGWDGVGTGMTVSSNGTLAGGLFGAQGLTILEFEGGLILEQGATIGFTALVEEDGTAFIAIQGYYDLRD